MATNDVILRSTTAGSNDVVLQDPTTGGGGTTYTKNLTASLGLSGSLTTTKISPPAPTPAGGGMPMVVGAMVLTEPSKLTKKKKRRVKLAVKDQLMVPADLVADDELGDTWKVFDLDLEAML